MRPRAVVILAPPGSAGDSACTARPPRTHVRVMGSPNERRPTEVFDTDNVRLTDVLGREVVWF